MLKEPLRVLIADDHPLFRSGMRALLAADPDTGVVGEATTGEEAIELAASLQPDVFLMDVQMPGISGIEATRLIDFFANLQPTALPQALPEPTEREHEILTLQRPTHALSIAATWRRFPVKPYATRANQSKIAYNTERKLAKNCKYFTKKSI